METHRKSMPPPMATPPLADADPRKPGEVPVAPPEVPDTTPSVPPTPVPPAMSRETLKEADGAETAQHGD